MLSNWCYRQQGSSTSNVANAAFLPPAPEAMAAPAGIRATQGALVLGRLQLPKPVYLAQVLGEDVVPPDAAALHSFLLAALLAPHSLGVPFSEEETARAMAAQAKVVPVVHHLQACLRDVDCPHNP